MSIPRFEVGNFRGSCFSAFFPLYSLAGFSRRVGWLLLPTRKTCLSPFERTIVAGGSGWLIFDRVCTILREECSLRYVWRKNRRRYAQGRSKEQRGIKGKFRNTTGNTGWNICPAQTENSHVTSRPFSLVLSAGRFREHSRGSETPGLPWNHCSRWHSLVFSLLRAWTGAQCTSFFLLTVPVSLLSAPGLLFPLARLHSGSPFLRQKSQSYWWKRVVGAKDVFLRVDGIVDGIDVARL